MGLKRVRRPVDHELMYQLRPVFNELGIGVGDDFVIATSEEVINTPRARRSDPETSHAAARSVRNVTANQQAVLGVFRERGPLTDEALVNWYSAESDVPRQSPSGIRTRRRELVDKKKVVDTGEKRALSSGRQAIVWAAAPQTEGALF
jgi:hypothetical protein